MVYAIIFIAVCFLAYSNGANDNFKGVATLFGSGTASFKEALTWATITTFLGSVAAVFIAQELVKNFSGKGLLPDELMQTPVFAISIALGAATTVLLATKIGMPISTTHSLVGALLGCGLIAVGSSFNFEKLTSTFLIPLIVSPLIAVVFSLVIYIIFRRIREYLGITKETCMCIGDELIPIADLNTANTVITGSATSHISISFAREHNCVEVYRGRFMGINIQKALDMAHYISSGIVSFARGLNDTPKIAGILIIMDTLNIKWGMIVIGIAIATGGMLSAKKVGKTMSKKITTLNHGQGFTANLITGLLVTTASVHGIPVSTTHVSVGSIFGIGMATKKADVKVIGKILLSWLLTLPIAAILSAIFFYIILFFN